MWYFREAMRFADMPDDGFVPDSLLVEDAVPTSLSDRVRMTAAAAPDRIALRAGPESVSWAALDQRIDRLTADLRSCHDGARTDDPHRPRVVLDLSDPVEFAVAYLSCLRSGLVATPVDPDASSGLARRVIADSGAVAVVRTGPDGRAAVGHLAAAGGPAAPTGGPNGTGPAAPPAAEDLAVLLYPARGSGGPAVMLPHRTLTANHEQLARIEPPIMRGDDTVLIAAPLWGAYGLTCGLGAVAYHGASGVLADPADPVSARGLVAGRHVTTVVGVPQLYVGWSRLDALADELRTVRVAVCGPAPLDADVARRFTDASGHRVFVGYGTREAPILTSTLVGPAALTPHGRPIGRPLPGVQLRLSFPDGVVLAVDDEPARWDTVAVTGGLTGAGAIAVRGPNLFTGYWPDGRDGPDRDGWWATGDLAFADPDGLLYLAGAGPTPGRREAGYL
ncbi:class I adenylate-forming enzyme family protein [Pilimelia columellifera]|uniref:AMP-dependent synthetase/ligase domain-containing protein n=1 Tax=Pilimelia columellifera subsp. columellifera TaxID=706583 RepID=A0ABN3NFP2_9ACTN